MDSETLTESEVERELLNEVETLVDWERDCEAEVLHDTESVTLGVSEGLTESVDETLSLEDSDTE